LKNKRKMDSTKKRSRTPF